MRGIYPGTFDPITNGHLDIIKRATRIVDSLVVAVGHNTEKVRTFGLDARLDMVRSSVTDCPNVEVVSFSTLLVEAAREYQADVIIRGLRAISDYEHEVQMAIMNRTLDPDIDTIIMVSSKEYSFISSSMIKEIASFGGDISPFVPESVLKYFDQLI
ncbi:MAG: pantetheine-phosphate adenylyltransferase [bacterium]|nr:pantetheine-phosphate adenylyltransferase [bacterium]